MAPQDEIDIKADDWFNNFLRKLDYKKDYSVCFGHFKPLIEDGKKDGVAIGISIRRPYVRLFKTGVIKLYKLAILGEGLPDVEYTKEQKDKLDKYIEEQEKKHEAGEGRMSSCTECHGAEGNDHMSNDCPRFKEPSPTQDEEIERILKAYGKYVADFYGDSESTDSFLSFDEAKASLCRLMLKARREEAQYYLDRIENLEKQGHTWEDTFLDKTDFTERVAQLDAELEGGK